MLSNIKYCLGLLGANIPVGVTQVGLSGPSIIAVSVQSAIAPVDVVALKTNLLCVVLSTSKGVPTMLVPSILSHAGKDPDIIFTDEMVKLVVFKGNAIVVDTRSANTPNS